jgi:hypothetical protein
MQEALDRQWAMIEAAKEAEQLQYEADQRQAAVNERIHKAKMERLTRWIVLVALIGGTIAVVVGTFGAVIYLIGFGWTAFFTCLIGAVAGAAWIIRNQVLSSNENDQNDTD